MESTRKKIAVIFGTRPDTIKLAPVIQELQRHSRAFSLCLIATGQHREMLDDVLSAFSIAPTYDLNVMGKRQTLSSLTHHLLEKLDYVMAMESPDMAVVQGDTATTFAASLAAFHRKIPVAHVEAGLRSNDKWQPFPEETYRTLTTHIADLHFAPTPSAVRALTHEGISKRSIICTGNTVIDALHRTVRTGHSYRSREITEIVERKQRIVVITTHRRENLGEPMSRIAAALKELAGRHPETAFVFPLHLNPAVREVVLPVLKGTTNIHLIEPLNYPDFINLIAETHVVITDSGGLQEEAPALGIPVLVLREVTERPEAVRAGTVKLVGTETKAIVTAARRLLENPRAYRAMASAVNPYGDGHASERIAGTLLRYFGFSKQRIKEFSPARP